MYTSQMHQNVKCCDSHEFTKLLKSKCDLNTSTQSITSYIIIDISNYIKQLEENESRTKFIMSTMRIISQYTEDYYLYFLITRAKIRLLLDDVGLYDTQIIVERILNKLYDVLDCSSTDTFMNLIRAKTVSFQHLSPFHQANNVKKRNISNPKFNIDSLIESKAELKNSDDIPGLFIRWDHSSSSNEVKTLTAPIFWDAISQRPMSFNYRFLKRGFDIFFSLLGIVLLHPIIAIAGLAIKVSSPGPVFFKQERRGFWGKPFSLLKFRIMHEECDEYFHRNLSKKLVEKNFGILPLNESSHSHILKVEHQDYTPVGRFLNTFKWDRIPILFNILRGDLSFIGPRPPFSYEIESYKGWHFKKLFHVKPGASGLWKFNKESSIDDIIRDDIEYADTLSLQLDLKILFKTIALSFHR